MQRWDMNKFDTIIIGAGPAGLTAALVLARAGKEVLVLERGEYPGSKNMFGGVLYSKGLHGLIPDFWDKAPIERPVARWVISALDKDASFSLDYKNTGYTKAPYNAFTVLRSKFDCWYARQAEEAGATLLTDTVVEDFLWEQGRVVGVKTGRDDGELFADVVISADGVNSLVARKGVTRKDLSSEDASLGVKEILAMPAESINRAFSLTGNEGAACTFVGASTQGIPGGGFIYTNRDKVSIGIVVKLSSLSKMDKRPEDLLEDFKRHPMIWPLIKEGENREYLAHLIPEGIRNSSKSLYKGGLLAAGDAAGFTLSTGFRVEGVNLSIMSGIAAAETIKHCGEKKDFSDKGLSIYPHLLRQYGVLADVEKFRHAPHFLKNPRLYQTYPELVCQLGESLFGVEPGPKKGLGEIVKEAREGKQLSRFDIIKDIYAGWRGLA